MPGAIPVPDNFDPTMPLREAARYHKVHKNTVSRWRAKIGAPGANAPAPWTDDDLHRLRTNFNAMSYEALARMLGRSVDSVRQRANRIGLKKASGTFAPDRAPQIRGRVTGIADMAQQHLQRFAPCFRCDESGTANPKGKFFRFGNAVLSEDEMMERAERKGWRKDAWRELA